LLDNSLDFTLNQSDPDAQSFGDYFSAVPEGARNVTLTTVSAALRVIEDGDHDPDVSPEVVPYIGTNVLAIYNAVVIGNAAVYHDALVNVYAAVNAAAVKNRTAVGFGPELVRLGLISVAWLLFVLVRALRLGEMTH
jgi:hypothetical protein